MPIHDYECPVCGREEELLITEKGREPKCPKCDTKLIKLLSAPGKHSSWSKW